MKDRIALITGASRGIGAAAAKRLAKEGAQVILVARNGEGLKATDDAIRAAGGSATLVQLDLTDSEKIDELAAHIAKRFGKLDILVGNAGILGELAPMPHLAPDVFDKVMATNLTANWHLIRALEPLLKASSAPRAMFVTSDVTDDAYAYWGAYAVSKAALEMMVLVWAAENVKTPLKINLIDPGEVRTHMNAQAFPGLDPMTRVPPEAITDVFAKLADPNLRETGKKFHAQN